MSSDKINWIQLAGRSHGGISGLRSYYTGSVSHKEKKLVPGGPDPHKPKCILLLLCRKVDAKPWPSPPFLENHVLTATEFYMVNDILCALRRQRRRFPRGCRCRSLQCLRGPVCSFSLESAFVPPGPVCSWPTCSPSAVSNTDEQLQFDGGRAYVAQSISSSGKLLNYTKLCKTSGFKSQH